MAKIQLKAKAIIFDMDGVITNTMPDHFRIWKKIFAENGIQVNRLDVYQREGEPGLVSILEIFKAQGRPIDRKGAKIILSQKEKQFKKIVKQRFIVGCRSFVKSLHRQGFQLALVTGTSRHELIQILPRYLRLLFDIIITGNEVKRGKPHPEPYLKAIKRLNIKSSDAVVIENAPYGIQSAKKAKIRCLAIKTSLPELYLKKADYIFKNIKDIQSHIKFNLIA